jgi:hypothetical protein
VGKLSVVVDVVVWLGEAGFLIVDGVGIGFPGGDSSVALVLVVVTLGVGVKNNVLTSTPVLPD